MGAKDFAEPYLKLKAIPRKYKNRLEKLASTNIFVLSKSGDAVCGSCKKTFQIKAKHKAECECPKCKRKMTVQYVWRMSKYLHEYDTIAVPQMVDTNCVVIRYMATDRTINKNDYLLDNIKGTPWMTSEVARIYYHEDYAEPLIYEKQWNSKTHKLEWKRGKGSYFRPDTYSIMCRNSRWIGYAISPSVDEMISAFENLDCFKYYPLKNIWDENESIYQIFYLMRTARFNEKAAKLGLDTLIQENHDAWCMEQRYNYERHAWLTGNKPILKTLKLNKTQFEIFKQKPNKEMLKLLQSHPDVTMKDMETCEFSASNYVTTGGIAKTIKITRRKLLNYLAKYHINVSEFLHFIHMLEKLKYDVTDTYYSMPKDFRRADEAVTYAYLKEEERKRAHEEKMRLKRDAKKNGLIAAISKGLREMPDLQEFLNGSDGLLVHIPESAEELHHEGKVMHNCIGSYVDRIANKSTLVFYVRRIDKPNEAFVAFEYRDGEVVQCRYKRNEPVDDPKIINFVDHFAKVLRKNNVLMAA